MAALTFVHLSDLHFTRSPDELLFGAVSPRAMLQAAVAVIHRLEVKPAFFVISGDLAHEGDPQAYRHLQEGLKELLAPFGVPVLLALGNHDDWQAFSDVMAGVPTSQLPGRYCYSQWVDRLRVIVLDSHLPGRLDGELGAAQLAWLEQELAVAAAPEGELVVVHHPVVARGIPMVGEEYVVLRDRDDLAALLAGKRVLGILSGHTHVATTAQFGGTVAVTAGGTAFRCDPALRTGLRLLAGGSFNLCTLRDATLFVNPLPLPSEEHLLAEYQLSDASPPRRAAPLLRDASPEP
ncbi:MAG: phosphodiesterase [Dehalococcoidia bacterium]|nr:MAG: phosphodiesterase [Dehalococcoidia bacterium]